MASHRKHRKPLPARLAARLLSLARATKLVARTAENSQTAAAAADLEVLAAATISNAVVPETVDDIDPGRQAAELPARTTSAARAAVAAAQATAGIPDGRIEWTYHHDGANGRVSQAPDVSDEWRRGAVAAVSAALGTQVEEHQRGDGYATVAAAGEHPHHPGLRLAVAATCCRADLEERTAVFEKAVEDLAFDWPAGPARTPIPVPAAPRRLALPAPRQAT